jgi:hypothetical protein
MLFSELENYTLYQAELNVITINENQTVVSVHIDKPIAWRSLYGQYTIDDFR